MFLIIIITSIAFSALVEYLLHRIYLHKDLSTPHILEHHKDYNSNRSFYNEVGSLSDIKSSNLYLLMCVLLSGLLGLFWLKLNLIYFLIYVIVSLVYFIYVEYIHYKMHTKQREKFKNILMLKVYDNHFVHHEIYDKNYGIGSYFWDIILKTKKK